MDYPLLEAFEEAILQEDEAKRMQLVSKGLKKITDILPFPKQNHLLLLQRDILKYLFLNIPLFEPVIKLIIDTFIEKFGNQPKFIDQLFASTRYISEIREAINQNNDKTAITSYHNYQNQESQQNIESGIIQDDFLSSQDAQKKRQRLNMFSKFNLPKYIQNHIKIIKKYVLIYVKKIIQVIMQRNDDQEKYANLVCEFYKQFLDNTDYDDLISEACKDLYYFKNQWICLKKNHTIMQEVEEILLLKSKKFKVLQQNDDYFNDDLEKEDEQEGHENDKNLSLNSQTGESDKKQDEKDAVDLLEDWLSSDDVAQLSKIKRETESRLSIDFFKIDSNLEILLSFIINPTLYTCSRIWTQRYQNIIQKNHFYPKPTTFRADFYRKASQNDLNELQKKKRTKEGTKVTEEMQSEGNNDEYSQPSLKRIQDVFSNNYSNDDLNHEELNNPQLRKQAIYYLRSYRTAIMLTDPKNYRPLIRINNLYIDIFFNNLYECFKRDTPCMNMNHIAINIEYLIGKEPELVFYYLIEYNILFKVLQMMEQSHVVNFLLNLILQQGQYPFISKEMNEKLWFYLTETQFYFELCQIMLFNKMGEYFQQKAFQSYKLPGLRKLAQKAPIKKQFQSNDMLSRDYMFTNYTNLQEHTFELQCDIDGLKDFLVVRKSLTNFKSKQTVITKIKMLQNLGAINSLTSDLPSDQHKPTSKVSMTQINQHSSMSLESNTLIEMIKEDESKIEDDTFHEQTPLNKIVLQQMKNQSEDTNKASQQAFAKGKNSAFDVFSDINQQKLDLQRSLPQTLSKKLNSELNSQQGVFTPQYSKSSSLVRPEQRRLTAFNAALQQSQSTNSNQDNKKKNGIIQPPLKLPNFIVFSPTSSLASTGQNFFKDAVKDSTKTPTNFGIQKKNDLNQKTLARLFNISELSYNKDVVQVEDKLNFLYPQNIQNLEQTPLDILSKSKTFNIENLIQNEEFSYNCITGIQAIFEEIFNQMDHPQLYKSFRLFTFDTPIRHLKSLLGDKLYNFDLILKHFLLKLKLYSVADANSSILAGQLANRIIQSLMDHSTQLKDFIPFLIEIINENWNLLLKQIILNFTISKEKNQQPIRIQSIQIEKKMSSTTYQIVKLFLLCLQVQTDPENKKKLIKQIPIPCLHALVLMFFEYPTNNLYQTLFIKIINELFKFGTSQIYYNIIFQFNVLNYMNIVLESICCNGVFNKKLQIDGIYYSIKQFCIMLEENFNERQQELKNIRTQVESLDIWHTIKKQFHMKDTFKSQELGSVISKTTSPKGSSIFANKEDKIKQKIKNQQNTFDIQQKLEPKSMLSPSLRAISVHSPLINLNTNNSLISNNSKALYQTDRSNQFQNASQNFLSPLQQQNKKTNEYVRHSKSNSFNPYNQEVSNHIKNNSSIANQFLAISKTQTNFKIRTNSQSIIKK
ncbi:hypothetical protein TTHERM_00485880 (macronuclear) [Tetrahymena thermophila SB210]|uniref:Uncharacterized protein n=1 Tax=Tetrahymena thermophila (strain SB210) TaxID=312017 RepID=I7MCY2_TETTS|nr:hypothetical protein TTHERM_00485880 [Tetrahymena thermophila SB210]EAR85138.3 hypothetical protein TTHERM_00485880 [Tetrahymena thermophila SB210]|eukprot:XP_001032801.3 hypothetical protein TTHERM_00485880 [Tetrahymena thermophila SB210]